MTSLLLLKSMLFSKVVQNNEVQDSIINTREKHKSYSIASSNKSRNFCRVCCIEEGIIKIFDNKKHPNMPQLITQFSGINVHKEDGFPEHICLQCYRLFEGCIKFRQLCKTSSKKLTELKIKKEAVTNINEVKFLPNKEEEYYNIPSPTFSDENIEIWTCTTCRKVFQDMHSYNEHSSECMLLYGNIKAKYEGTTQHDGSKMKNFLCDICGKMTNSNANLIAHMAIHENLFPFKCDQCPYQGRTTDLLRVHKRTHLIDKPYKCAHCPKACSSSSNLTKHKRRMHGTAKLKFQCTYCDRTLAYQHALTRHIQEVHLRLETFECDICLKKFNTRKVLRNHRLKVHKIRGQRHGRLPAYLTHAMENT